MDRQPTIHVTFPVLNEEAQLADSIERTMAYCQAHGVDIYEFCIADNGSTDRTRQIGERLAADSANLSYIRLPKRGFGLALKTAWGQSKADFVGYMDIDLATELQHLKHVRDLTAQRAQYVSRLAPERRRNRLEPHAAPGVHVARRQHAVAGAPYRFLL